MNSERIKISTAQKTRVLFLCTGNSCRSQMAEGWARALIGDRVDAYSAGTEPHGLNPLAVKAMQECGIDISKHSSKTLDSLGALQLDLVVTVCDKAAAACPTPPKGARFIHVPFDDPPRLALSAKTEQEALLHYRRVRDEIKAFVIKLPTLLDSKLNE